MLAPRLPPYSVESEEAVLGSILLDSEAILKIPFLSPDDFYRDQNREIYSACLAMSKASVGINQVTLAHFLGDRLPSIGGGAYLTTLLMSTPTPLHVEHYAQIVHKTSISRRLLAAGEEITRLGYEDDPEKAMERAEGLLFQLRKGMASPGQQFATLHEVGLAAL